MAAAADQPSWERGGGNGADLIVYMLHGNRSRWPTKAFISSPLRRCICGDKRLCYRGDASAGGR